MKQNKGHSREQAFLATSRTL
jgi:hypothetical protein